MIGFSLRPDSSMRWIYDYCDPRYNDPATKDLRDRRDAALRSCPDWMRQDAATNDALADLKAKQGREFYAFLRGQRGAAS